MFKESYCCHSQQSSYALDDFSELCATGYAIPYILILVQHGRYFIRKCHLICSPFLVQILYCHIYTDEVGSHKPSNTCKNNLILLLSLFSKTFENEYNNGINSKTTIFENIVCMQAGMRCFMGRGVSLWRIALIHVTRVCTYFD